MSEIQSEEQADADYPPEALHPVSAPLANPHLGVYRLVLKETRSWGVWLLALGAMHLLASGTLSASWGVTLLIVGAASFYFREAAMFVVYAVTLAWVAISNLRSGEIFWVVFALVQVYFAVSVMRQFFRLRAGQRAYLDWMEANDPQSLPPQRAAAAFPWLSAALGVLSLLGLIAVLASVFILAAVTGRSNLPSYMGFLESMVVNLSILGFSVGLGALLSGYRYKAASIAGVIAAVLTLGIEIALLVVF